jgi:hypothetical protein
VVGARGIGILFVAGVVTALTTGETVLIEFRCCVTAAFSRSSWRSSRLSLPTDKNRETLRQSPPSPSAGCVFSTTTR